MPKIKNVQHTRLDLRRFATHHMFIILLFSISVKGDFAQKTDIERFDFC